MTIWVHCRRDMCLGAGSDAWVQVGKMPSPGAPWGLGLVWWHSPSCSAISEPLPTAVCWSTLLTDHGVPSVGGLPWRVAAGKHGAERGAQCKAKGPGSQVAARSPTGYKEKNHHEQRMEQELRDMTSSLGDFQNSTRRGTEQLHWILKPVLL